MARTLYPLLLAAALVASVAGVHGAVPLQDDAGSGADAGDAPDDATLLASPGAYQGNLSTPTDADWYRLSRSTNAICVDAHVEGPSLANATLGLQRSDQGLPFETLPSVEGTHNPSEALDLAVASPDVDQAYLGLDPTYTLSGAPGPDAGAGQYTFDLQVTPVTSVTGDAGAPGDAPAPDHGTPHPLPDACFGGVLDPDDSPADADGDADVYAFEVEETGTAALSLVTTQGGTADTNATLVAPNGTEVLSVASGGLGEAPLSEKGTWKVVVEDGTEHLRYAVGFTQDDDGPPSCRPSCMSFTAR